MLKDLLKKEVVVTEIDKNKIIGVLERIEKTGIYVDETTALGNTIFLKYDEITDIKEYNQNDM